MNFGAGSAVVTTPVEVVAPLDKAQPALRRGESVRLEVVVRTRKVGHFFPGGTVDGHEVWVELEAVDSKGRTIMHSGKVADDGRGPVEPGAHFYKSLMLDGEGNPINKRNAWAARSVAYVRLVPPGAADTIHYRLDVPADAGDAITITARVNYRKFNWWNTQWAYAGVRDPAHRDVRLSKDYDNGRWVFTGDTSTVSLVDQKGMLMIERKGNSYRFVFRNVDRMRYCGMEGKINGSLTVTAGRNACTVQGVMDGHEG